MGRLHHPHLSVGHVLRPHAGPDGPGPLRFGADHQSRPGGRRCEAGSVDLEVPPGRKPHAVYPSAWKRGGQRAAAHFPRRTAWPAGFVLHLYIRAGDPWRDHAPSCMLALRPRHRFEANMAAGFLYGGVVCDCQAHRTGAGSCPR